MSRIVRSHEPPQPVLPLGHGPVQWSTLPEPVRERVLTLWRQVLTEHLASTIAGSCRLLPHEAQEATTTEEHT